MPALIARAAVAVNGGSSTIFGHTMAAYSPVL